MNRKKLIVLLFLVIIILVVITVSSIIIQNGNEKKNSNVKSDDETSSEANEYSRYFSNSIDLEKINPNEDEDTAVQSDFPGFGSITGYYKDVDIYTANGGSELHVQTNEGYDVVYLEWKDEGMARYINQPTFGVLKTFTLSNDSISATLKEVTIRNVESYIAELTKLGFTNVQLNKHGKNFYYYTASKNEASVTLNLDDDDLLITVNQPYNDL